MSKAAVAEHIRSDGIIKANTAGVYTRYDSDEPPSTKKIFIILRWDERTGRGIGRHQPRILTVWVHQPKYYSTNYDLIDRVLERVEELLLEMQQVPGKDGYTVTSVRYTGTSGDLQDPGYETITRNSAFEVLYHST